MVVTLETAAKVLVTGKLDLSTTTYVLPPLVVK